VGRRRYGSQWDDVDTSLLILLPRGFSYELIWIRPVGYVNAIGDGRELGLLKEEQEKYKRQRKHDAERAVAPSPALRRSLRARSHWCKE
jgi:hypothetical protein